MTNSYESPFGPRGVDDCHQLAANCARVDEVAAERDAVMGALIALKTHYLINVGNGLYQWNGPDLNFEAFVTSKVRNITGSEEQPNA